MFKPPCTDQPSEAALHTLVAKAADGVLVLGSDGVIRFVNPAAERLLGRGSADLLGASFGVPILPEESTEIDIVPSPEHGLVVEMRVVEIDWDGEQAHLATLHDITERKRASEALRFLAEAGTILASSLDTPTTLTSVAWLAVGHLADWCLIDLLDEGGLVRRVVAHHSEQALEAACGPLCGEAALEATSPVGLGRVLLTGQPVVLTDCRLWDLLALHPGQQLPAGVKCAAAMVVPLSARGRTLGAISFIASGPRRRYLPSDLALAEELGRRAAVALDNATLYEAREAVRVRDDILAQLAHEMRNPLAPILHAVQMMRERTRGDKALESLVGVIDRQGHHLSRLLDDLLDVSRMTRGKLDLRKQAIDLATVVADGVETSRPLIEARRHALTVNLPPGPLHLEADPTRLGQVISNLLNNAAKYTPPGGRLALSAGVEGQDVVVRVRDNGVGIPREMLARVFEPFVQIAPLSLPSQGGLGIGLTLVRALVELHGGRVTAASDGEGRGTEVVVSLPRGNTALEAQTVVAPRAAGCRVVLVEDHPDGRGMLRDLLRLWGHEVEEAEDGLQGLETIQRLWPEVALIDIGLPGLTGYQVAEAVRKTEKGQGVLLIALTGYGQPEDRQRALAAGFDAHLVKPPNLAELERLLSTRRRTS